MTHSKHRPHMNSTGAAPASEVRARWHGKPSGGTALYVWLLGRQERIMRERDAK